MVSVVKATSAKAREKAQKQPCCSYSGRSDWFFKASALVTFRTESM